MEDATKTQSQSRPNSKTVYSERLFAKKKTIILQAIASGASLALAAAAADIVPNTIQNWMQSKPGFADEIAQAEQSRQVMWLARIEQAAQRGDWHADAWKLEHLYPNEYGKSRVEVSGKDGGPIDIRSSRAGLAEKLARRFKRNGT